ncbi:hypothetical protein LJ739_13080 [Aestuariibacter halophilus]|uniref:Uncharacterized protein n=1 Tax=Fluctibacter halophilus TaxID=226011 RepID=A0ABS8G9G2_9ALTE|nr:hypothetical protein [Aestuariibacter halophilus]MCC2617180.1 hypothetical protein [Aestuariibacter halophilus]
MRKCGLLLIGLASTTCEAESLPPILDYFPGCHYQTLATVTETRQLDTNLERDEFEKDKQRLLRQLQTAARDANADALVITDLEQKNNRLRSESHQNLVRYTYTAKAISGCETEDPELRVASEYTETGQRRRQLAASRISSTKTVTVDLRPAYSQSWLLQTPILDEAWKQRPPMSQMHLNSKGTLQGVNLGASMSTVVEQLGYPSAEWQRFEGIKTFSYGRQTWLHFRDAMLVGIDLGDPNLPNATLNEIPLLSDWNDSDWQLNDNIVANMDRSTALTFLPSDADITDKQAQWHQQGTTTRLTFRTDGGEQAYVAGVSLRSGGALKEHSPEGVDYQPIVSALSGTSADALQSGLQGFAQRTPQQARIHQGDNTYLDIYDNGLAIQWSGEHAKQILIRENLLGKSGSNADWQLTPHIRQGATLGQLQEAFGDELSAFFGEGTLFLQHYDVKLYFDGDDDDAPLYAAELTLY